MMTDIKDFLFQVCVMAWNKIYKREFVESLGARFPDGLIFEDGPFFFSIFFHMGKVSLVDEFLYYYRINRPNSIIDKGGKNFIDLIKVTELLYKELVALPYYDEIQNTFIKEKLNDAMYRYRNTDRKYKKKFFEEIRAFYSKLELKNFDIEYPYSDYILSNIKENNFLEFEINTLVTKFKDKVMSFLYRNPDYYTIRLFNRTLKLKKCKKIIDIWYSDQFLYIKLLNIKTFRLNFKYRIFGQDDK
jgi:hypothetical protein